MGGGGGERKLFLTVSGGAEGEEEHVQEVSSSTLLCGPLLVHNRCPLSETMKIINCLLRCPCTITPRFRLLMQLLARKMMRR